MSETSASVEYGEAEARYYKVQDRTSRNFGFGDTDEALAVTETFLERLVIAYGQAADAPRPPAAPNGKLPPELTIKPMLSALSPDIIALAALSAAIHDAVNEESLVHTFEVIGHSLTQELFASGLRAHDSKLANKIEKWVKEKHGNIKFRLQAARSAAKKGGYSDRQRWTAKEAVAVGSYVVNIMLEALPELFTLVECGDSREKRLEIQGPAFDLAADAVKDFVRRNPIFLPSVEPPVPWTDWNKGGPVDPVAQSLGTLVRTRHRETTIAVRANIRSGKMQPALDALNAAQATPWAINKEILNVALRCHDLKIPVKGIPQANDIPQPELTTAWDDMSEKEQKFWRKRKDGIKKANRALFNDRMRCEEDLETAEALAVHERFYTPCNLDWRGRVYAMPQFNFQRNDLVRSLFTFADGEAIGEEGTAWLKVHTANCGDFERMSKKSYDERVEWVDRNVDLIAHCAADPLCDTALAFWTKADKPFLFLAACFELSRALEHGVEYVCSLPVSWDGTCSGLQHLCSMTRAEEGSLVNLTDQEQPQDVYKTVAERAFAVMAGLVDDTTPLYKAVEGKPLPPTVGEMARRVMGYNGDRRSLCKRNVMTFSYGSAKFGMAQQHMDDLMEPLELEVMKGSIAEHPFGDEWTEQQNAARFLASHIHAGIEDIVNKPARAMAFLQDLAKVMAHAGKPLEWTTPVGLPWSNRYHENKVERLELWLHDKGARKRYQPVVATGYAKDIDKKRAVNGSAPNFVHACDGSHLLLTVLAGAREGMKHFALVHDSFGCLPSRAARLQGIIREELVTMYEEHDVLNEVYLQAKFDLNEHDWSRLPDVVEYGNLNIKEILNAKYAFA